MKYLAMAFEPDPRPNMACDFIGDGSFDNLTQRELERLDG